MYPKRTENEGNSGKMGGSNIGNLDLGRIVEGLGLGVLCCRNDSALTIAYASGSFYSALGYGEGEIPALLPPAGNRPMLSNETPIDWREVSAEIRERGYAQPELRLIRKNGHHIWVSYRVRIVEGEDGCEYFCGLVTDITLQRRSRRLAREQKEELEALTENVPGGVLRCRDDEYLTLDLASEGFCRITGYSRAEIRDVFRNRFLFMVYEKDRELLMREIGSCLKKDVATDITYRIAGKEGRLIWVLDKARRTADCNGNAWIYSVLIDITEMKKAQDDLAISEERYRVILEQAADPVLDCDLKSMEYYYSPAFRKKFGPVFPANGDLFRILGSSDLVYPTDRDRLIRSFRSLVEGKGTGDGEYRLRDVEKGYVWCNVHAVAFFDRQGTAKRMVAILSDIDKRKRETLDLREKAEHDLLTGLFNQVTTMKLIDGMLASSSRGDRHALFVIDIDNFKYVNDHLGHLRGDELIVQTAVRLRRQFREGDIVGRVGGDEFVIFLKKISSVELVVKKAEMLRQVFRDARSRMDGNFSISGSIGIAFYPNDGRSYDELFKKADAAMYAAKRSGKDSYRIYVPGIEKIAEMGDPDQP